MSLTKSTIVHIRPSIGLYPADRGHIACDKVLAGLSISASENQATVVNILSSRTLSLKLPSMVYNS